MSLACVVRTTGFVVLCTAAALAADNGPSLVPIDTMRSPGSWNAVGRAGVESRTESGASFLRMTFGGRSGPGYAIVQGPIASAAAAWAKRGALEPNAFAVRVRASRSCPLFMLLRIRRPGVPGPKGVVTVRRAEAVVSPGNWQTVLFPFTAFNVNAGPAPVDKKLFATLLPQVQFSTQVPKPGEPPVRIDVAEVAFAQVSPAALLRLEKQAREVRLVWQGVNLAGQAAALAGQTAMNLRWQPDRAPGYTGPVPADLRRRCLLRTWRFVPVREATGKLERPAEVELPHDFPGRRDYKAGWYVIRLPALPADGIRYVLCVDAAALYAAVVVNNVRCGEHLGSFTPFECDLTGALHAGTSNVVAIYVHDASNAIVGNRAFNQLGVWRPGILRRPAGGLRGGVWLEKRPPVCVANVFVKTSVRRHRLTLVCEVRNRSDRAADARLVFSVKEWPAGGDVRLAIPDGAVRVGARQTATVTVAVPWPHPRLWSPDHPNLYVLQTVCEAGDAREATQTRFGFREFRVEGDRFLLNEIPVVLLGESHYRFGPSKESRDPVTGREFNREVMTVLKRELGFRALRLHASIMPANVAEAADEVGMLLIDQSGIWSAMGSYYRRGGKRFLDNTRREFAEWVRRDRNRPSVVIWDVENEMIRGSRINLPWVMQLDGMVRAWDDTRPVEHSGAGWYDPKQQIVHLHMQEHYTGILERWRRRAKHPLIVGEFWVGGRGETRLPSSLEFHSKAEWYAEENRIYLNYIREMRRFGCSGVMPFRVSDSLLLPPGPHTRLFAFRPGKPIAYALRSAAEAKRVREALAPVTAFFWPRSDAAVAGEPFTRQIVMCNDSEQSRTLTVRWGAEGASLRAQTVRLVPGEQARLKATVVASRRTTALILSLAVEGWGTVTDRLPIRPLPAATVAPPRLTRRLCVYGDASGSCAAALRALGLASTPVAALPADPGKSLLLVAPYGSDPRLDRQGSAVRSYLAAGGRVLCLAQERWPRWAPVRLAFWPAVRAVPPAYAEVGWPANSKDLFFSRYAPIYAPEEPVFAGITAWALSWWSARDGRVSDDAIVRPSAVGSWAPGAWRVLAGACRRENASLVEMRVGRGTAVFCQAQVLAQRANPQARAVLMNLLRYLDGPAWQAVNRPVVLNGTLSTERAAELAGTAPDRFSRTGQPAPGALMIATDGADLGQAKRWAQAGGTVLVLSAQAAGRIPGFAVTADRRMIYGAARAAPHPLLRGVSTADFTGFSAPCVHGVLTSRPAGTKILLAGLAGRAAAVRYTPINLRPRGITAMDAAAPVAVSLPEGRGEWVVTTLEPWRGRTVQDRELWSLLLANAGVDIPPGTGVQSLRVRHTVPLRIDGRLDDWTNDIEDPNVSPYGHAVPIVLSSEDAVRGVIRSDDDLSGIAYLLWTSKDLCIAAALFGHSGGDALELAVGRQRIALQESDGGWRVRVDGHPARGVRIGAGRIAAQDLLDARRLSFTRIGRRVGNLLKQTRVTGRTVETAIPWTALGLTPQRQNLRAVVQLTDSAGRCIRVPTAVPAAEASTHGAPVVFLPPSRR